jgi:hypothetical protein
MDPVHTTVAFVPDPLIVQVGSPPCLKCGLDASAGVADRASIAGTSNVSTTILRMRPSSPRDRVHAGPFLIRGVGISLPGRTGSPLHHQ